jgi:hypothetical protein
MKPKKPRAAWRAMGGMLLMAGALTGAMTLGGCTARAGAGETAAIAPLTDQLGGAPFLADLPALEVSYNAEGAPSIGATALGDLQALVPATLLSQLTLDAATVERLSAAGIQHIQVSNTPTGLRILVNGEALPALVWDATSLDNLLNLLQPLEPDAIASLGNVLDLVTNLGAGLVIRLPLAAGEYPIPLLVEGPQSNAAVEQAAQEAFLESTGTPPRLQIPVFYAEDGTWTVQGLSDTEWQALTGLPFGYVRLNPQLVQGALDAGITQVVVWTDREGIHVTLGEQELPYVRWADGGILTLLEVAGRLGVLPQEMANQELLDEVLAQWLPILQATDLRIVVQFPAP